MKRTFTRGFLLLAFVLPVISFFSVQHVYAQVDEFTVCELLGLDCPGGTAGGGYSRDQSGWTTYDVYCGPGVVIAGADHVGDYYIEGTICPQTPPSCPQGYVLDSNNSCVAVIDGGWSPWSDWGACSASCGGGTQTATRTCTNPSPANGGADCVGDSSQTQSCNTQVCATGSWSYPSDCPTSCGQASSNQTQICTGGNGVCSGSASTRSCDATAACSPTETGSWSYPSDCPTSCGQASSNQTQVCTGGNGVCSGSASTRSCSATAACASQCLDPNANNFPAFAPCDYKCSDGSIVSDPNSCPSNVSSSFTCSDGSVVSDSSQCPSSNNNNNNPIVETPVTSGFTLDGPDSTSATFLASLGGNTKSVFLTVNPFGSFSDPVTVTVQSTTCPYVSGYSFDNGDFTSNPSTLMVMDGSGYYRAPSGNIGLYVVANFSQGLPSACDVILSGTGGGLSATHTLEIDPNAFNPNFKEL